VPVRAAPDVAATWALNVATPSSAELATCNTGESLLLEVCAGLWGWDAMTSVKGKVAVNTGALLLEEAGDAVHKNQAFDLQRQSRIDGRIHGTSASSVLRGLLGQILHCLDAMRGHHIIYLQCASSAMPWCGGKLCVSSVWMSLMV
jgi:hypothetical protein